VRAPSWPNASQNCVHGKRLDRTRVSLDGTLIPSHEFTEQTGYGGVLPHWAIRMISSVRVR
jgi:hypothetical protein